MVVDVLGDAHRAGTHHGTRSGQVGRVTVDHTQSVAVGTRPLPRRKAHQGVGGGSRRHVGHPGEADRSIGCVGRVESHSEPTSVGHAQIGRHRTAVPDDHIAQHHVTCDRSACVVVDVLGNAHRAGGEIRVGTVKR